MPVGFLDCVIEETGKSARPPSLRVELVDAGDKIGVAELVRKIASFCERFVERFFLFAALSSVAQFGQHAHTGSVVGTLLIETQREDALFGERQHPFETRCRTRLGRIGLELLQYLADLIVDSIRGGFVVLANFREVISSQSTQ